MNAWRAERGAWVLIIWLASTTGCASSGGGGLDPNIRPANNRGPDTATAPRTTDDTRLVGGCGEASLDLRPKYVLPFPVGDSYLLTQGNCGGVSHEGRFSFAFDFRMPIGTPVIAARDGVVYALRADRPDGSRAVGDENYVFLEHDDGEISRYIHLTTGGVLVRRGNRVSRGDTIALSGNSGQSAFPHLHFDVARGCGIESCITVPAGFVNATPAIPLELRPYRSESPASPR